MATQHAGNLFGCASQEIWRQSERIDFCLGAQLKRFSLAIASGVIQTMCSHSFNKYPRHRWTVFDSSISELGTLEAAHQILSKAFRACFASYMN